LGSSGKWAKDLVLPEAGSTTSDRNIVMNRLFDRPQFALDQSQSRLCRFLHHDRRNRTQVMRSVCVYCGSSFGRQSLYADEARVFGRRLVERGLSLVYGGGCVGVMGVIADAVLEAGGNVIGVIPQSLVDKEVAHKSLTELIVTQSMHERKTIMAQRSDAFVALPGGIGTLEELFEIWTWGQLGLHEKPCGLLNIAGYYDGLIAFLDHAVDEQFLKPVHRSRLIVETDAGALLDRLETFVPTQVTKWIEPGDE
jgi:uncharacterized protein (TIGR00730 family)